MSKWSDYYRIKIRERGSLEEYINYKMSYKRILLNEVKKDCKGKIMEVGCGTGISLINLKREGYSVMGVDIDNDMLTLARELAKRMKADIHYVNDDLTCLAKKHSKVDCIFSNGVFEHFSDDMIIKTINLHLNIASRLVISVPTSFFSDKEKINGDERFLTPVHWINLIKNSEGYVTNIIGSHNFLDKEEDIINSVGVPCPFLIMTVKK